jgi:hypothetical protein
LKLPWVSTTLLSRASAMVTSPDALKPTLSPAASLLPMMLRSPLPSVPALTEIEPPAEISEPAWVVSDDLFLPNLTDSCSCAAVMLMSPPASSRASPPDLIEEPESRMSSPALMLASAPEESCEACCVVVVACE